MGLAGQVRELLPEGQAVVRTPRRELAVSLVTLDEPVRVGSWVLVHSGFALGVLTETEAMELLAAQEQASGGPA